MNLSKFPFRSVLISLGLTVAGVWGSNFLKEHSQSATNDWLARIGAAVFGMYVPLAERLAYMFGIVRPPSES